MPFKQTFEQNLNNDMQGDDGQPGRAPSVMEDVDLDIKKDAFSPPQEEFSDSKEQPPRFSTLYGVAPKPKPQQPAPLPTPPPPPQPRDYEYQREYYGSPPRTRRSGVTIPMPLFIVLSILFAFMSTILFAYTVIGLYNNAPSRVFPWAGPGTATAVCNPVEQQPSINFAPNFMMPQADKASPEATIETVTVSATPSTITVSATPSTLTVSATPSSTASSTTSSTSTSESSTTSSTTSSSSTTTDKAAAASDVAGLLGALGGSSSITSSGAVAVVTVGPTPSTVTSVKLVTKDPSGKVIPNSMVTLTSVTVVPASSSAASITSRAESTTAATSTSTASTPGTTPSQNVVGGWAAVSSVLEDADSSSASPTASGS